MTISDLVGGALSAVIGGGLTAWAAIYVFRRTQVEIEASELRVQRTRCIIGLIGLRWVLSDNQSPLQNPDLIASRAAFTTELNKVIVLWAHNEEVVRNLRDFDAEQNGNLRVQRLVELLRSLGTDSSIDTSAIADSDLKRVILAGV